MERSDTSSGARIVFRSFLQPVFAKYFSAGSTADNLKAQSDKAQ
jgi:receptor expression-enhancing protein 5/6